MKFSTSIFSSGVGTTQRDLQIKLEQERDVENFIGYVEDFLRLTSSDEQKGIRELHQDFTIKYLIKPLKCI